MRILSLNYLAFGPFTNKELSFKNQGKGVHLVFGPNEAGKSSALRGLHQFLFGIPQKSLDAFVHPYDKLRVAAQLLNAKGEPLEFVRRKGRVNTLRGPDDVDVVDEDVLHNLVGGMREELFKTLFGLNHDELVQGGQGILEGKGELGQVIFSAGAGLGNLRDVQETLKSRAEALFAPRGRNQFINKNVSTFTTRKKELAEAQLPSKEWERHFEAKQEAEQAKEAIDSELKEKLQEKGRLQRIQDALGDIGRRKDVLQEYQEYERAPLLEPDFSERRREAVTQLAMMQGEVERAQSSITRLQTSLEQVSVPQALLEQAEGIKKMHQELGSNNKAMVDRPILVGKQLLLETEAKTLLQSLRKDTPLDQAATLRLGKAASVRVRELGNNKTRLAQKLEGLLETLSELDAQKKDIALQLERTPAPKNVTDLATVIRSCVQQGDMEALFHSEKAEFDKMHALAQAELKRQTLFTGSLADVENLALPVPESLDRFENDFSTNSANSAREKQDMARVEDELRKVQSAIARLQGEGAVPTEQELEQARTQRSQQWTGLRAVLQTGDGGTDQNMVQEFERTMTHADTVADRLRREADRVAQLAALLADQGMKQQTLRAHQEQLLEHENQGAEIQQQWRVLWEPLSIVPQSPREMRAWAQKISTLAQRVPELREREHKCRAFKERIQSQREQLNARLGELGLEQCSPEQSLRECLNKTQTLLEQLEQQRRQHEQLERDNSLLEQRIQDARVRADGARIELEAWQGQWADAVRVLGLDAQALPAEAFAVMDDITELMAKLKDIEKYTLRVRGIDRDYQAFTQHVEKILQRVDQNLEGNSLEQNVEELNARLIQASTAAVRKAEYEQQLRAEEKLLQSAKEKLARVTAELNTMCGEAACSTAGELPIAEQRSEKRRALENELQTIETRLRDLCFGATLESFISDALAQNPDELVPALQQLDESIEQLAQQKSQLDQTIGSEQNQLSRMDGGDKAAGIASELQTMLATLDAHVENYVQLALARTILRQAIEQYREKHQGPILERAATFFKQMTLNSFSGLRVEFSGKEDILVGVRDDKSNVPVQGMSHGTRDQLYLAVRLASLESYLKINEPMPFIVDDVCVNFDDERTAATLEILSTLSTRTQVVFFTHHAHLLDMAEKHVEDDVLACYEL